MKQLTGSILLAVLAGAGFFEIGCSPSKEVKAAQFELTLREDHLIELENFSERTPDVERAILNEEEKIITLKSKLHGQVDDTSDKIHGSGPYNAYLVIAKRPPLSEFEKPKDQRSALTDDRIRSLPGVISVKLLYRAAQDGTLKKDPAGLFSNNTALQDCLKAADPNDPLGVRKEDENHDKQIKACVDRFGK